MPTLHPNHKADLAKRGLSRETIDAAGIYSESDSRKLATLLNRKKWDRKLGSALVFPFHDEMGTVVLHRVKPDNRPQRNGKPGPKYLSPSGALVRAYIPPMLNGVFSDPTQALLATEGEFKTLKATQEGFPAVGLTGVDCWHSKKSTALIPDLARIEWQDRTVYICFDSDALDNENVQINERLLAGVLQNHGARVKIVRLPPGPDGAKVGVDDFLVAHGAPALHKLLAEAEDPEPVQPDEVKQPASEMLPEVEAEAFVKSHEKDGHSRLWYWRDTWWVWRAGAFRESPDSAVRAEVAGHVNRRFLKVGRGAISNVMAQVEAQAYLQDRVEAPEWLAEVPGSEWPTHEIVITKNKIVHLPSLFAGKPHAVPVTPALFCTSALDFRFAEIDKVPESSRWLQFLGELWPDDEESIESLQLWFGYCITPDCRQHKMLGIFGPKRSGKSTIGTVLRYLVGWENTCAPTLSSFGSRFGLWPLVGKSLAVVGDARLGGRADAAAVSETLLTVSGQDAVTIDRKCIAPITAVLPTRVVLLSNELPRMTDASATIVSRMIVLRLTRSWFGQEDTGLLDTVKAELPGIFWWALHGWHKLQQLGRLLQPESATEMLEDLEGLASPVITFVRDQCKVGPGETVDKSDLYAEYADWCKDHGITRVPTQPTFGRDLRAAVPALRDGQRRVGNERSWQYIGVGLRPVGG